MNSKKIFALFVVLVIGRATFHLFAATTDTASMSTPALERNIVQTINQLLGQIKGKAISQEEAQTKLNQVYDLVGAYEKRTDKNNGSLTAFKNSLSQVIPQSITASLTAGNCPAPEKDPGLQILLKEAGATTIAEATAKIKEYKAEVENVLQNLSTKDAEFVEPEKPVVDRDLEKLFAMLDATSAKEARKNIEALEQNIEKRVNSIAKIIQISYLSIAQNANSPKLLEMIKQYSVEDFIKPKTLKTLNDVIANILYQARTDIFTMKQTLIELDTFFRSNPTLKPPRYTIEGEAQKQGVASISLD